MAGDNNNRSVRQDLHHFNNNDDDVDIKQSAADDVIDISFTTNGTVCHEHVGSNGTLENGLGKQEDNVKEDDKQSKAAKEKKQKPKMVSTLQLFRFADKLDIMYMIIGTICAMAHGVALPVLIIIFGDMTDSFVRAGGNVSSPEEFEDLMNTLDKEIRKCSLIYMGIAFGTLATCFVRVTLWLQASHRQTQRIRRALLKAILRQEIGWFDMHKAGELGTRLASDVNKIQEGIGDKFGNFSQFFTTFIAGIIIGLAYGWKLALVIFACSPLLILSGGMLTYLVTSTTTKELSAYAKAGAVAEEVLSSIRTVVAFGGQTKECHRYYNSLSAAKDFGIRKSVFNGGGMGLILLVLFMTYGFAFWYGGKLIHDEPANYTIGTMLTVLFSVTVGAFALGNAAPNLENIATARAAAYFIWDIIDRKPAIDSFSDEGLQPESLTGNIELKDVVFRYPSRPDVPVANGLSIQVMKGQTVALVGASGCGKSTVVQLLQRFYDPLSGTVYVDGTDIRQLNVRWLRRHIGIVSQEPVLFATTIGENIRYGRDDVTQEEIEKAAMEANVHNFISKLPLKYDTLVGERGAQLSGGQKQRIAIARALVRNPQILLLDEATSALDTESEASVQAALDKARLGRTTIVIAHRLSTIKTADVIYGIKDGVVHETGTHAELMQLGGIYYQLVTNQQIQEAVEEDQKQADDIDDEFASKLEHDANRSSIRLQKGQVQIEPSGASAETDSDKEEKLKEVSFLRVIRLNASEWPFIVLGCIMALVEGGVQPAFAIVFSSILGVFASSDVDYRTHQIFIYSMMIILIGGLAGIAYLLQGWMFGISGERLTMRIRQMTFKALLRQEIAFFDDHENSTGALTTRLSTDATTMQGATGVRLGMLFQSLASIGAGIVIAFVYSWKLALFILALMPFFIVGGILEMKGMKGFAVSNKAALEHAGQVANEAIVNVRTVASLTKEPKFVEDYERLTDVPYRLNLRKSYITALTFGFSQSLLFFAYAAIFTFGAWLVHHDGLNFESMFKVFAAIIFGAMSIGQASQFAPDYGKAKLAATRIFKLIDQQPVIDSYSPDGIQPTICNGTVEFRDVHFRYPTRQTVAVLQGLSFSVEQGNTIALVGASGCGKSTTIQLLQRFYDALDGQVCIDGVDIRQLNIQWLRSRIGIVSQEPTLFDSSIAENIAYGDNSREVPMDEIVAAARMANIHNFIQTLPQGYNTNVGAKGTQLSGGQKQRIAIARALIRNPKILLLDEATSALDTESEKVVQEALERAQEGRTSLVVAHRLSTVQNANCIIVISRGRVAELGTHAELLGQRGLYYRLQQAQALNH